MRVCFVSSYPPNRARLSEYGQNLVTAIANRPAIGKVYVLADTVEGSSRDFEENSKIEVLRVWKPDDSVSILGILWHILKLKPDIVHFNVHFRSFGRTRVANFLGFSLVFLSRMFGLRTIVLLHNLGEKVNLEKLKIKPSLVNKIGILVATRLILSASSIVVIVPSYAQFLKKRYRHKGIQYIPHGTSLYNHLSVNHKEKVVLMFGNIAPSKGFQIMFQAYEEILKKRKEVKLVIAGESHPNFPGYLDELKKSAPSQVNFLGYLQEEDLASVFSRVDVVVLPYLTATGTSGVFHIACGFGRPVVASDLPEIREMVDEGASAILVPPGNADALKEAILKVLFNKELATKMSEQNLFFAQRESWSSVAKDYEEAYLSLLHR